MVLSDKGGSLCVKDVFAKKFFDAGRDSADGALASVLRKHSTEGRTPDAAERRVTHRAGSRPRDIVCRKQAESNERSAHADALAQRGRLSGAKVDTLIGDAA
jgi:hypothetical protein